MYLVTLSFEDIAGFRTVMSVRGVFCGSHNHSNYEVGLVAVVVVE